MLGRFLELSVHAPNIVDSLGFYRSLGFSELRVLDTWKYEYTVISDGKVCIGLHGQAFEKPTMTFVYPELEKYARKLQALGHRFTFSKLGDDVFNEIGFADPDKHVISLQEARSFSPPDESVSDSLLGSWLELTLPSSNIAASARFWAPLAPSILHDRQEPTVHFRFDAAGIALGLSEDFYLTSPSFCFVCTDRGRLAEALDRHQIPLDLNPGFEGAFARLQAPEGTHIFLFEKDFLTA